MGAPKKYQNKEPGKFCKTGAFSLKELKFITENLGIITPEKIAEKLNRNLPVILKHIEKIQDNRHAVVNRSNEADALRDLRIRPFWKQLKKQYSKDELDLYEFHWAQLRLQFNDDVTHAEELQICRTIDLEIQMHRNKIERREIDEQITKLQRQLDKECLKSDDLQDKDFIQVLMQNLAGMRSSQMSRSKEHNDMLDKYNNMLKSLKSTRDQRFKDIQDKKITFLGWIAKFDEANSRSILSKEAELLAMAVDKAEHDLEQLHTYDDGLVDAPLLNSSSIERMENE